MKGTPDCPTLLHYLAKVLLKSDPSLVTFIEEMPHVEAAARGESSTSLLVMARSLNTASQFLSRLSLLQFNPLLVG